MVINTTKLTFLQTEHIHKIKTGWLRTTRFDFILKYFNLTMQYNQKYFFYRRFEQNGKEIRPTSQSQTNTLWFRPYLLLWMWYLSWWCIRCRVTIPSCNRRTLRNTILLSILMREEMFVWMCANIFCNKNGRSFTNCCFFLFAQHEPCFPFFLKRLESLAFFLSPFLFEFGGCFKSGKLCHDLRVDQSLGDPQNWMNGEK